MKQSGYEAIAYPAKHILIKIFIFFIPNWFFENIRLSILLICFHICESSFFDVRICKVSYSKLQIRLCFISTLHWCFQYCLSQTFLNIGFDVHSLMLYVLLHFQFMLWLCTSDIFTAKFTLMESIDYNSFE